MLEVLYEDNHIIVVRKEANIPTQEDSSHDLDLLNMVKRYIKEKYKKPGNVYIGLVHRLDRPVGGVMVFARSSKAASRLNKQLLQKQMQKKYYAVVHGILSEKEGRFVDKLEKLPNGNTIVSEKGKESILNYKVLKEKENLSLIDISLETGRHHQIRVQFSSRNHPLCGDQRYGIDKGQNIALFAYELSFFHPITKEKMTFNLHPKENVYFTKFEL